MTFDHAVSGMLRRAKVRRRKLTGIRPLERLEERNCPALALTPAGTALGLTLSTFASGFPPDGGTSPGATGYPSSGGVLADDNNGDVLLFPSDADGQVYSPALIAQNYGSTNTTGMATINGVVYMVERGVENLVQLNGNGTFNQNIASVPSQLGLAVNPANGHLIVAGTAGIYDVNPATPGATPRLIVAGNFDGDIVSADGSTVYAANISETPAGVTGYNTTTGAQVFDSGPIAGAADGSALGGGSLAGFLVVNTNGGTVVLVNLSNSVQTVIANGGGRGDFVTPDPNGTLILSSGTFLYRLSTNTPPPVISSLSLATFTEGAGPTTLTVTGTGFFNNAVVNFNGNPLPTTFVNSTQLTAIVPASDLVEEGSAAITTVFNPNVGGGTSNAETLPIVDPAVQIVNTTAITGFAGVDTGLVTLATFSDPGGSEPVASYSATVNWGDGTPPDSTTPIIVDNGNGTFSVEARHTYALSSPPGSPYQVTVSICHENQLINGGFEQPVGFGEPATIPGWTLQPGTGGGAFEIAGSNIGTPFEGNQFTELNSFGPATIFQTVPTIPGQTYQLRFAFSARPGTTPADNDMQVSVNGTPLATVTADGSALSNTQWQVYTYTVTATSAATTIQFASLSPPGDQVGGELDAVSFCPLTTAGATATILAPVADLSVTKTGPGVANAGGTVSYLILVTNNGPMNAMSVDLTDALPSGMTLVGQSQGGGPVFTLGATGNTINDTIAVLPSGASSFFSVTAKLSATATNGSTISNTATVSSTTHDTNLANNTSTASLVVHTQSDLVLTAVASPSPVAPGGLITYTVTITNNGPSDAMHVLFNDSLPSATTFVSQTQGGGPAFTLTNSGNAIGDSLLDMPSGATQTFTITARVKPNAAVGSNLPNSAVVTSFTTDANLFNNTSSTTTPVGSGAPTVVVPSLLPNQDNKKKS